MLEVILGLSLALNLLLLIALKQMRREVSRALQLAQVMLDRALQGQDRDKSGRFVKKAKGA